MAHRNKLCLLTATFIVLAFTGGTWMASPGKGSHASAAGYTASSATFDGTTDRIRFTSSAILMTPGKVLSVSFWVNLDNLAALRWVWAMRNAAAGAECRIAIATSGAISVSLRNSSDTVVFALSSDALITAGGWHHVLFSVNTTTGSLDFDIYIDGVDADNGTSTFTADGVFALDRTDTYVGADSGLAASVDGCLAELWVDDSFIDWSVQATREKFATPTGEPVDLGADGSTPTGSAPDLYMKFVSGSLGVNSGADGGTGTLNGNVTDGTCGTVQY